jgi:Helix-turn-helix of DDE superfamily endonuclease
MYWNNLKLLTPDKFQRYTGIKLPTFERMVETVKTWELLNRNNRSRPHNFSIEDRILMMLCYYREYITFFHLALKYQIHESTAFRIVVKIENILIKSGAFSLPKSSSVPSDTTLEVVVIDASESPIERPKSTKHQKKNYSGKKNDIPKNSSYS